MIQVIGKVSHPWSQELLRNLYSGADVARDPQWCCHFFLLSRPQPADFLFSQFFVGDLNSSHSFSCVILNMSNYQFFLLKFLSSKDQRWFQQCFADALHNASNSSHNEFKLIISHSALKVIEGSNYPTESGVQFGGRNKSYICDKLDIQKCKKAYCLTKIEA